jgi:DNA-binding NtrC family response regulator
MMNNSTEGPPVAGGRNNKVLIVDDNEQITLLLKEILEMRDFEVYVASSASEAIEAFQGNDIDTVITDMKLDTQTTGLDVIKQMKKVRGARFIVSSGYANGPDKETMDEMGIKGFLAKPFVFDDLFKLLEY